MVQKNHQGHYQNGSGGVDLVTAKHCRDGGYLDGCNNAETKQRQMSQLCSLG